MSPCDRCGTDCYVQCGCGRGRFASCHYQSCFDCFLDRRAEYVQCVFCGKWHSPLFDTCFTCRQLPDRDEAGKALRQLILWRDDYRCQNCQAREGDERYDPRTIRSACSVNCETKHAHRSVASDGMVYVNLQVDHIIPCSAGGTADEWNLRVLCNVCNAAKGAFWYVGCGYEDIRTELCRRYFLLGRSYFRADAYSRFQREVRRWRRTGTWDPNVDVDLYAA